MVPSLKDLVVSDPESQEPWVVTVNKVSESLSAKAHIENGQLVLPKIKWRGGGENDVGGKSQKHMKCFLSFYIPLHLKEK